MARVIFCILGVILTACGHTASQSIPAQISGNKNQTAQPTPAPSPATISECADKRIYGLPKGINIPQQLCIDDKKPIDKGEDVMVSHRLVGNTWKQEYEIPFAKLPPEVQNIVRLTTGERFTQSKYNLFIILSGDESQPGKRSVKTYRYFASDGEPSWDFKRQDKMLKLDGAQLEEIKEAKNIETKEFITVNCTKNKISTISANAKIPTIAPDLCFDDKRSADGSEYSKATAENSMNPILRDEENISFNKLPPEVQNIIRVTSEERNVNKNFYLTVMLDYGNDNGAAGKKVVKDYLYYLNRQGGKDESWTFRRQDSRLKLTQADILKQ